MMRIGLCVLCTLALCACGWFVPGSTVLPGAEHLARAHGGGVGEDYACDKDAGCGNVQACNGNCEGAAVGADCGDDGEQTTWWCKSHDGGSCSLEIGDYKEVTIKDCECDDNENCRKDATEDVRCDAFTDCHT